MNTAVFSENAPKAIGPYSQGIKSDGKTTVYVSGQLPVEKDGSIKEDIVSQTKASLNNIRFILEKSGASLTNVVKTTVLLDDINNFAAMNEVYATFFKEPYPARVCYEVSKLPKGAKVEIDAIAVF